MNPEILLYDEPTSGLDPVTSRKIDRLIAKTNREQGATSVVVTHDLISAMDIATRIMMLHEGQVVEYATPEKICLFEGSGGTTILRGSAYSSGFRKWR